MAMISYPVYFNNINLESIEGLTVLKTDPYKLPRRKLTIFELARTSKSKINTGFFNDKAIMVRVGISRKTRDLVEQSDEALTAILQDLEKDLVVRQAGDQRRYTASLEDKIYKHEGGSYLEIDIIFRLSDRYGYDLDLTELISATGRTLYNYTDSFTIAGNAKDQAPVIKITLNSVTGATNKNIVLTNPATGESLTVNRTWEAGDVLVMDAQAGIVTVNGDEVDYDGTILYYPPGIGYLQYTDGFATRSIRNYSYYYKRYV